MKYNPFRAAQKELETCKKRYLEILDECHGMPDDEQLRQMEAFLSGMQQFAETIRQQAERERKDIRELWKHEKARAHRDAILRVLSEHTGRPINDLYLPVEVAALHIEHTPEEAYRALFVGVDPSNLFNA